MVHQCDVLQIECSCLDIIGDNSFSANGAIHQREMSNSTLKKTGDRHRNRSCKTTVKATFSFSIKKLPTKWINDGLVFWSWNVRPCRLLIVALICNSRESLSGLLNKFRWPRPMMTIMWRFIQVLAPYSLQITILRNKTICLSQYVLTDSFV